MNRQPRILLVNMMVPGGDGEHPQYPGEWRDGYELSIALASAGADVTLLSPSIGRHEARVRADIDSFAMQAGVKLRYARFVLNRRAGKYMALRLSLAWLLEYVKLRPDLIIFKQLRTDPALLLPFLKRRSLVLTCEAPGGANPAPPPNEYTSLIYRAPSLVQRMLDGGARMLLYITALLQPPAKQYRWTGLLIEAGAQQGAGARPPGCLLMPKGILPPDPAQHALSLPGLPDAVHAVFCGSITYNKGIFELITAWRRLPRDLELFVVGAGIPELEQRLAQELLDLPNVHYLGALGYFEKFDLIRRARLFVLPSKSDYNPSAVLEALALGVPVITSRQIISPITDGQNGLLVDAYKPDQIASAVVRLLEDEDQRRRMAAAAGETAARYSWDRAVSNILSLLPDEERRLN